MAGFEPAYVGFADRCVDHFTTCALYSHYLIAIFNRTKIPQTAIKYNISGNKHDLVQKMYYI